MRGRRKEDEEDEDPLTREDLEAMSDEELMEILDYLELEYAAESFDREEAIATILEVQNESDNE